MLPKNGVMRWALSKVGWVVLAWWAIGHGPVSAQTTSTWITVAGGNWGTATNWSPASIPGTGTIIADFSTLALTADLVVTQNANRTIGGFRFGDTDGTPNAISLNNGADNYRIFFGQPGAEFPIHVANGQATIYNRVNFSTSTGTRKTGAGTLSLAYNGNAYGTNGIILVEGITAYASNSLNLFSAAPIVYEGGTLLWPFGAIGLTPSQTMIVNPAGGTMILTNGTATYRLNTADLLRGTGTLTLRGGGRLFLFGSQSTFGGTLALQEGTTLLAGSGTSYLMPTGSVQISVGSIFSLQKGSVAQISRLTGTGDVTETGSGVASSLTVGDNGVSPFSFVYYGANNSSINLTKTGTSTMVWAGTNSHSGATTVGQGTMIANGLHTGGANGYTIDSGATLGGTGTIRRTVAVNGIVAPGEGGIGTLNVSNVTWNSGASWSPATDWVYDLGASGSSDLLNISGTFTRGGGLVYRFDFGGHSQAGTYKLVDWTVSTTFNASDFSYTGLGAGLSAAFMISGSQLDVVISSCTEEPTITLGSSPSLCTGLTSTSLPYSATTESPDQYSIDYSTTANNTGLFTDVTPTALPVSPIPITVSAFAPAGVYTGTLTVLKSSTGCRSSTNFTVTVLATPAVPGGITQGNPSGSSVCAGASGVTYSISPVSMATTYTWGVPSGASITAGQGTTAITVNWGTAVSGNVTVNAGNTCGTSANQSLAVTVRSGVADAPAAVSATEVSSTSFIAQWGTIGEAESYRLDVSTDETFAGGFIINNDTEAGTSRSVTGLTAGQTYFYRVRSVNACGTSTNSSTITVFTPFTLAAWDFNPLTGGSGNYGASPLAPTSYATNQVSVVGWTRGGGVTQSGTAAARGWGGTGWESISAAAAISANKFATHTIQASVGMNVSFHSINRFDYRSDATGPTSWTLQYSIDGSTFSNITSGSYTVPSTSGASNAVPISLLGISELQDVPDSVTVTFRLVNSGASSATGPWYLYDKDNSTAFDFDIRGTTCSNPAIYTVTGGGAYCSDDTGVAVGLSDSESNVRYQLYRNGGATAVGSPVSGTGNAISFGLQTVADTYTVEATRIAGECTSSMSGSVAVSITTTPGAPTGLGAVTSSGQVDLNWTSPGGSVTSYSVKRASASGGPYTTLPAGSGVVGTTFSDTTALNGNTYYYVISAFNGVCEGNDSSEIEVVMPAVCPEDVPPTMNHPGDRTATVGNTVFLSVTVTDAASICDPPDFTAQSTIPSFITYEDSTGSASRTRSYTIAPTLASQTNTYPIRITATDSENLTTSLVFLVYIGSSGEPNNNTTNPPPSQTNWFIRITNLEVPVSGNATVEWSSVVGMTYDVYSSTGAPGSGSAWSTSVVEQLAAGLVETADVVAAGSMRFYQVVPHGLSRTDRGVWGIVRPSIPANVSFMSVPLEGNRDFGGTFGDEMAASLTTAGTKIYIMEPGAGVDGSVDGNGDPVDTLDWIILERTVSGWERFGGGALPVLNAGQGFLVNNIGGSASPTFSGPVGNTGTQTITLAGGTLSNPGFNIIGISEGKAVAASTAFDAISVVGSFDENQADQVVIMDPFRRLIRRSDGTWYDTGRPNNSGETDLKLLPGQAYYYIRRGAGADLDF
jgi:autotransporter-associated beta strand protein